MRYTPRETVHKFMKNYTTYTKREQITQEEFNRIPVVDGIKQCPLGDYSQISSFAERCSFENGKIPKNYKTPLHKISGFGSRQNSELYFWDFQDGIFVRAGCFFGTLQKFTERVIEEYGETHEYITISNMMKELLKLAPAFPNEILKN